MRDVCAEQRGRASRVDAVGGQKHHVRAGRNAVSGRSGPGDHAPTRWEGSEDGSNDTRRQIVGDLHGDRRSSPGRGDRGRHRVEERVAVAVGRAVHARETSHFRPRRAGHESRDHDVDPSTGERGVSERGRTELHTAVIAPEGESGGIESDHGSILTRPSTPDAAVPTRGDVPARGEEP
ncbi:hypothetical protein [Microbacterium sp. Leaf151]|uniref:hypothetical protein n=1 Tax=Microbacterium sp. Leaf151 TaxID=1736276 RepID=UPI0012E3E7ED|nr:hypothetical protein [Microbacterium sp. Leaf151]